ncbi:MAG: YqzL family protein [Oscillospiraceae bacterium]|nr:YqzL family protein [Oscillospiraceae bacterium]
MDIDLQTAWRLFAATGNILFYLLYKELRERAEEARSA